MLLIRKLLVLFLIFSFFSVHSSESRENKNEQYKPGNEALISQLEREKKTTQQLMVLGALGTSYLAKKTYSCCAATPMCVWCIPGVIATGMAFSETRDMYKQTSKIKETIRDLRNPGKGGNEPEPAWEHEGCAQDCLTVLQLAEDDNNESAFTGGGNSDILPEVLEKIVDKKYKKGESPFEQYKNLSYDNLSPDQKKQYDNLIKDLAAQSEKYVDELGLNEEEIEGAKAELKKNNESAFTGGEYSSPMNKGKRLINNIKRKRPNLAKQMQHLLKNYYANKNPAKKIGISKTTNFGSDTVGVVEDNIFMMAHRRHRSLDSENLFIKDFF